jgi:hypothetical protein
VEAVREALYVIVGEPQVACETGARELIQGEAAGRLNHEEETGRYTGLLHDTVHDAAMSGFALVLGEIIMWPLGPSPVCATCTALAAWALCGLMRMR